MGYNTAGSQTVSSGTQGRSSVAVLYPRLKERRRMSGYLNLEGSTALGEKE